MSVRPTRFVLLSALALPAAAQDLPDHAAFRPVLARHVRDGLVDYAALRENRAELDAYLSRLGATDPAALAAASREAQIAFWINAYNACTLRLVIDHYPIRKRGFPAGLGRSPANSIRQIPDTWSRRFCPAAGAERSLDEIEHKILRPIGEPRIHFAVNCASRSCPVLAREPYTADSLDAQLDAAVARFVADPQHFRLEAGPPPLLRLNRVFDWYREDFGGTEGVVRFLIHHLAPEDAGVLQGRARVRVEYLEYDWTLNDTAVFAGR
jgi:hypothetical protein